MIVLQQPSIFIKGNGFSGYIFDADHFVMASIENQKTRYTPDNSDIILAEKLVSKQLKGLNHLKINQHDNCPVIHNKLSKYVRQYVGFINNSEEKVIWVNCLWEESGHLKDIDKRIIPVKDGCSQYWSVKVNLQSQKVYNLNINGSS